MIKLNEGFVYSLLLWFSTPFRTHPRNEAWAQLEREDAKAYPEARRLWETQQAAQAEQDRRERGLRL